MQILDEVCILITDGTHYSPKDEGKGRPFVTVKDMSESGLDLTRDRELGREFELLILSLPQRQSCTIFRL